MDLNTWILANEQDLQTWELVMTIAWPDLSHLRSCCQSRRKSFALAGKWMKEQSSNTICYFKTRYLWLKCTCALLLLFGLGKRGHLSFHLQPLATLAGRADEAKGGTTWTISVENRNCCLGSLLNFLGSSEKQGKWSHLTPSQNKCGHWSTLSCFSPASHLRCPSAEERVRAGQR